MIKIHLTCAMCGKETKEDYWLDRKDDPPHYDFERDLARIVKTIGWVYRDDVCGDIYCSKRCAR